MSKLFAVIRASVSEFLEHDGLSSGAAMAYYTIFAWPSLMTLAILAATSAGFTADDLELLLSRELGVTQGVPPTPAKTETAPAGSPVSHAGQQIMSWALLLLSISGVFAQLQYSLNRAWGVQPDPQLNGMRMLLMKRVGSMVMVGIIGAALLASLVVTAFLDAVLERTVSDSALAGGLGLLLNEVVSLALITVLFGLMFRVLPDAEIQWRDVWVGAGLTALLFVAGKSLIGWYLNVSEIGSDWGATSSSILGTLAWVYYSSLIVLLGAEFTQCWVRGHGREIVPQAGAMLQPRARA